MENTKDKTKLIKYISLKEASDLCSYSQDYLSLRARQGKLKAVKMGRNWVTKKEWIEEYIKQVEEFNRSLTENKKPIISETIKEDVGEIKEIIKSDFLIIPNLIKSGYIKLKGVELNFGNSANFLKNLAIRSNRFVNRIPVSINKSILWLKQAKKTVELQYSQLLNLFSDFVFILKRQNRELQYSVAKLSKNLKVCQRKICQPKFVLSILLIILTLLGSTLFFNADARASLAKWTDKSIDILFDTREEVADFIYQQVKDVAIVVRGSRASVKETGSEIISLSAEAVSRMPLFIEQTTQSIEELPFLIYSTAQKAVNPMERAAQVGANGFRGASKSVLTAITKLPSKIISLSYSSKQAFNNASQSNEQLKLALKSKSGQIFNEFQLKINNLPIQIAGILLKAESASIQISNSGQNLFQKIYQATELAVYEIELISEKTKALPRQIIQWGIGQKSQTKKLLALCHPKRLAKNLSQTWTLYLSDISQSVASFRMTTGNFLKITVLSNFSEMSHNISDMLSNAPKKVVNKANNTFWSFKKSVNQKRISLSSKINEAQFIASLTLDEIENNAITRPTTAVKTGFRTVDKTTANIFDSISKLGEKTVQISKKVRDKMGDVYIKITEFVIPGYSLEDRGQLLPQKTTVIEEPVIQEIIRQVQQITPKVVTKEITKEKIVEITETVQSADLTEINQDIGDLSTRITNLASQISSRIDYTTPSYAPIYVPSSGLQVAGHTLLTTLNVTGSGALGGSLSVNDNAAFGNTTDTNTTFDVYSTATFHNPTTFSSSLTGAGGLAITGDGSVSGALSAATTTITGNFTVQDSNSNAHLYVDNNTGNIGIGTTTPERNLVVENLVRDPEILLQGRGDGSPQGSALMFGDKGRIYYQFHTDQMRFHVNGFTAMLIQSDGNVGIGDNAPDALLDISSSTASTLFRVDDSGDGDTSPFIINGDGNIGIGTTSPNSLLHIRKVQSGEGIYDALRLQSSTATDGDGVAIRFTTSVNNEYDMFGIIAQRNPDILKITSNDDAVDVITFEKGGNVGIGTTTPDSALTTIGRIHASSTTEQLRLTYDLESSKYASFTIDSNGDLNIDLATGNSTTTISDNLSVLGYLNVEGNATTTGSQYIKKDLTVDGDAYIGGNLTVGGSATIIGDTSSDTLVINSTINSDLIPDENATRDIGSSAYYWDDVYVDQLVANNISAASTTIAGTQSETFTINSNNATSDTEDQSLVFFRGTVVPNALLTWDSTLDRFDINQPLFIQNDSSTTTVVTLDIKGKSGQTADLFRISSSSAESFLVVNSDGNVGIGTSSPEAELHLYDRTLLADNPINPSLAGTYDTSGWSEGVYVSGKYAYVADDDDLRIIDISNPASPSLAGIYDTSGGAYGVYVSGKYAYVVGSSLKIIDISNPASPYLTGTYNTDDGTGGVYVSGKYAYVADGSAGLQIIDISNPTSPSLTGTYDTSGNAFGVYVSGKYAYVADATAGLQIIDISDPTSPSLTGTYGTSGANKVYVSGKYAYVADGGAGLRIINVSNPASPSLTGTYDTSSGAYGVHVSGKYAYVADNTSGLQIIDVSNPASPSLTGTYDTDGYSLGIYVSGKYAYVADGNYCLQIIDIKGADISVAKIGNIETNDISVWGNIDVGNNLYASGGINAGPGGIYSAGEVGIYASSSATALTVTQNKAGDILNIFDGTTEVFTILDGGNVGIGTTGPIQPLTIFNSNDNTQMAIGDSASFHYTIGRNRNTGFLEFNNTQTGYGGYTFMNFDNAELVTINNNGNVGIGTTTPSANLELQKTVGAETNIFQISSSTDADLFVVDNDGNVGIGTAAPSQLLDVNGNFVVKSTGFVGIGTNDPVDILHIFKGASGQATPHGVSALTIEENDDTAINFLTPNDRTQYIMFGDPEDEFAGGIEYDHSADKMTFQVNNEDKMVINSSGNVGIGTTSPGAKLEVVGETILGAHDGSDKLYINRFSTGSDSAYLVAGDIDRNVGVGMVFQVRESTGSILQALKLQSDGDVEIMSGNVGIGTTSPLASLSIEGSGNNVLALASDVGTNLVTVLNDGNVGIGTTAPDHLLTIKSAQGNAATLKVRAHDGAGVHTNTTLMLTDSNSIDVVDQAWGIRNVSLDGSFGFLYSSGDEDLDSTMMTITSSGNLGIGTTTPLASLSIEGSGNNVLALASDAGTNLVTVLNSGNIGIGTTEPGALLHVYGTIDNSAIFEGDNHTRIHIRGTDSSEKSIVFDEGITTRWMIGMDNAPTGNNNDFSIKQTNNGNAEFLIDTTGNVGIGTTTPSANLELQKTVGAETNIFQISSSTDADLFVVDNNGNVGIGTAAPISALHIKEGTGGSMPETYGVNQFIIQNNQATSHDTNLLFLAGTEGKNTINFGDVDDQNAGRMTYDHNLDEMFIHTGGSEALRIDSNGNVGIGTTSPLTKLSIEGTAGQPVMNIASSTGASLLYVNESGYMGIGTAVLSEKLEINEGSLEIDGTSAYGIKLRRDGSHIGTFNSANYRLTFQDVAGAGIDFMASDASSMVYIKNDGNVGIGTSSPLASLSIEGSGNNVLALASDAGTNLVTVLNSGNVGIGTDSPTTKLHVENTAVAYTAYFKATGAYSSGVDVNYIGGRTDKNIFRVRGATTYFSVDSNGISSFPTGNVGIGTTSPNQLLSLYQASSDVSLSFGDSNTTRFTMGTDYSDSQKFKIAASSALGTSDLVTVQNDGNVGIGTTTPDKLLTVYGSMDIGNSGQLSLPNGSVGAPSLNFTAFPTYGIYFNSATGMVFSHNGANAAGIRSNIFTLPSDSQFGWTSGVITAGFDTGFSRGAAGKVYVGNGTQGDYTGTLIAGNVGIGTTTPLASLSIEGSGNNVLALASDAGTNLVTVLNDGNVGIGTTTPAVKLDVVDVVRVSGSVSPGYPATGAGFEIIYDSDAKYDDAGGGSGASIFQSYDRDASAWRDVRFRGSNIRFDTEGVQALLMSSAGKLTLGIIESDLQMENAVDLQWKNVAGTLFSTMVLYNDDNFYLTTDEDIVFRTGATSYNEKMRLLENGNVGIGDTSPDAKFELTKTSGNENALFMISSTTDGDLVTVKNDGNIGIGVTSPVGHLHIAGEAYTYLIMTRDDTGHTLTDGFNLLIDGGGTKFIERENLAMSFLTNGTERMKITNDGNVGIGTTSPWAQLSVEGQAGKPQFISSDASLNTDFIITEDGNVGIGTTDPTTFLDVKGSQTAESLRLRSGGTGDFPTFARQILFSFNNRADFTHNIRTRHDSGSGNKNAIDFYTWDFETDGAFDPGTKHAMTMINGNIGIGTSSPLASLSIEGSGNNVLALASDAGTNLVTVLNSGNVGIGTTSPLASLSIEGSGNNVLALASDAGTNLVTVLNSGNVGIGTTSPLASLSIEGSGNNVLALASDAGTNLVTVLNSGDVGIGTASPTKKLTLGGVGHKYINRDRSNGTLVLAGGTGASDGAFFQVYGNTYGDVPGSAKFVINDINATSYFAIQSYNSAAYTSRFYINGQSGNVGIGTTTPSANLELQKTVGAETNIFQISSSTDADLFVVDNDGNVGIGTAAPEALLHVLGESKFSSNEGQGTASAAKFYDSGSIGIRIFPNLSANSYNNIVDAGDSFIMPNGQDKPIIIGVHAGSAIRQDGNETKFYTNDAFAAILKSDGKMGIGTTTPDATLAVTASAGSLTGDQFLFQVASTTNSTITNNLVVTADGNVGIGTGAPGYALSISKYATADTIIAGAQLSSGETNIYRVFDWGLYTTGDGASNARSKIQFRTQVGDGGSDSEIGFWTNDYGVSLSERMTIDKDGNVGIGTTSPGALLEVFGSVGNQLWLSYDVNNKVSFDVESDGDLVIDGNNNITINSDRNMIFDVGAVGNSRYYSFRWGGDELVTFKDGNVGIGTTSPFGLLSVHSTSEDDKPLFVVASTTQGVATTTAFIINKNGNVGIGTANPTSAALHVQVPGSSSQGIYTNGVITAYSIRNTYFQDPTGTGNYFQFAAGAGTTQLIGRLNTTNALFNIHSNAGSTGDVFQVASSSGAMYLNVASTGNVGIGTTSPNANLDIWESAPGDSDVMFKIASSTGTGFKILAKGEALSDYAFNSGGADYAEYFWTRDIDLEAGEVVCVDITRDNAVERCKRAADGNVMGIVSTHPAIVGNAQDEYRDNPSYKIIGMLGQVEAKVSAENGPIRPGDSLTSASAPGYVMRASAGDSTVGVALEGFESETGVINVLISRRNKSLTVETVEGQITERIATMEIEDEVNILITSAIDNLNLENDINEVVDPKLLLIDAKLTIAMDNISDLGLNIRDVIPEQFAELDARIEGIEKEASELTLRLEEAGLIRLVEAFDSVCSEDTLGGCLSNGLVIDTAGRFGIATTTPTNILTIGQGMGNAIADGWDVYSSREYKTDITYLEEEDYEDILEEIENLNVATYRWKADVENTDSPLTTDDDKNFGVIAEEAPERVLSQDGKSVSLYDYTTFAIAGVKAVNKELKELEMLLTVERDEDGNLVEIDPLEKLKKRLAELGLVLDEEGALIVDKIKAKDIETEQLKIMGGDSGQAGITLYDRITGQPYCLYIANGISQTVAGECGESDESGAVLESSGEPEPVVEEPVIESNSDLLISTSTEPVSDDISPTEEPEETPIEVSSLEPVIEEIIEEPVVEEILVEETPVETPSEEPVFEPEPEPVVEEPVVEPVVEDTTAPADTVDSSASADTSLDDAI